MKARSRKEWTYRGWARRKWPKHLAFVATFPCFICGGEAQVCHLRTAENSGMGLKPHDWWTVPLCLAHHREQESRTAAFCQKYNVDLWMLAAVLADKSPDLAMRAAMREKE